MKDARHGKDQPEGQAQRRIGPPPVIAWFHQHLSACEPLALAGRIKPSLKEAVLPDNNAHKNAANKEFRKARAAEDGKRALLDYENAAIATRAKTAKLRALRLARDIEQAAAEAEKPKVEKKKKVKSPSVTDISE